MSEQRYLEDTKPGDELAVMVKNASRAQLFLFSAATNNPHRIHYDKDYAASEGHPDVLVHGPLQEAWLAQFVCDWAGPASRLLTLEMQNRARAFPESDLVFRGSVTAVHDNGTVELELREENAAGEVLMPGRATVKLPKRS